MILQSGNRGNMQGERKVLGSVCANRGQQWRRAALSKKERVFGPRSSSPVAVRVEHPCIIRQAFSTIAWEDLKDCATAGRRESLPLDCQPLWHSSPCAQDTADCALKGNDMSAMEQYYSAWPWWDFKVNESDADDEDFGDYALAFTADSPSTLESSLSPAELVPFQGCVIPPLTPQWDLSPEDSMVSSPPEAGDPSAQDGALWRDIAQCQGRTLGDSMEVNHLLHDTLQRKREEIEALQERNIHLRQLANRAKHLASVLERLMTVRDPCMREPVASCGDEASLSPCKRQRLDEGYETESSDSVEDMLRDVSTRCNAVLHSAATGAKLQQESETIRMYGSFSGLQTSVCTDSSLEETEGEESVSSFRTSIREHCTIRTQVFPHGHAFTSRTQQGGYRFRWVPNHS